MRCGCRPGTIGAPRRSRIQDGRRCGTRRRRRPRSGAGRCRRDSRPRRTRSRRATTPRPSGRPRPERTAEARHPNAGRSSSWSSRTGRRGIGPWHRPARPADSRRCLPPHSRRSPRRERLPALHPHRRALPLSCGPSIRHRVSQRGQTGNRSSRSGRPPVRDHRSIAVRPRKGRPPSTRRIGRGDSPRRRSGARPATRSSP